MMCDILVGKGVETDAFYRHMMVMKMRYINSVDGGGVYFSWACRIKSGYDSIALTMALFL
jgi:hypothetical protein